MKKFIDKAITFTEYYDQMDKFSKEGKSSGEDQSDAMIEYTRVNQKRMKKWRKIYKPTLEMTSAVNSLIRNEKWILLTESWCGDAAQNVSQFANIADVSDKIDLKVLYRDENLELMDQFLTNGGRSIPKLIRVDAETNEVIGSWGPRVETAQKLVIDNKNQGLDYAEPLHTWYAKNKNVDLEKELITLLGK